MSIKSSLASVLISALLLTVYCGPLYVEKDDVHRSVKTTFEHLISQLATLIDDNYKTIKETMGKFPANYTNSTITKQTINGTVVHTNVTMIKETKNNITRYGYFKESHVEKNRTDSVKK